MAENEEVKTNVPEVGNEKNPRPLTFEAGKQVKVKLTKPHTHAGVSYGADQEILVDEQSALFIEKVNSGKRV